MQLAYTFNQQIINVVRAINTTYLYIHILNIQIYIEKKRSYHISISFISLLLLTSNGSSIRIEYALNLIEDE